MRISISIIFPKRINNERVNPKRCGLWSKFNGGREWSKPAFARSARYLDESSMEKNTYSPESTIPSCSAAKSISLMVVELAHITTTETKEEKKTCLSFHLRFRLFRETRLSANFNRRVVLSRIE